MPYTLAEAAVACGLDKSTVRRAVRAGKISGTKDEAGTWYVEPVELHRVFPPASRTEDDTTAVPLHAPSDAATDILVDELRAIIRASERREEDLRQERDRWRTAFENSRSSLFASTSTLVRFVITSNEPSRVVCQKRVRPPVRSRSPQMRRPRTLLAPPTD